MDNNSFLILILLGIIFFSSIYLLLIYKYRNNPEKLKIYPDGIKHEGKDALIWILVNLIMFIIILGVIGFLIMR